MEVERADGGRVLLPPRKVGRRRDEKELEVAEQRRSLSPEKAGAAGGDEGARPVGERVLLPARKVARKADAGRDPEGRLTKTVIETHKPTLSQELSRPVHFPSASSSSSTSSAQVVVVTADGWEDKFSTPKRTQFGVAGNPTFRSPSPSSPSRFTPSPSALSPPPSPSRLRDRERDALVPEERALLPAKKASQATGAFRDDPADPQGNTTGSPVARDKKLTTKRTHLELTPTPTFGRVLARTPSPDARPANLSVEDPRGRVVGDRVLLPPRKVAHKDTTFSNDSIPAPTRKKAFNEPPRDVPTRPSMDPLPAPIVAAPPVEPPVAPIQSISANQPSLGPASRPDDVASSSLGTSVKTSAPALASQPSTSSIEGAEKAPRRRKYSLRAAFGLPPPRATSDSDSAADAKVRNSLSFLEVGLHSAAVHHERRKAACPFISAVVAKRE